MFDEIKKVKDYTIIGIIDEYDGFYYNHFEIKGIHIEFDNVEMAEKYIKEKL